MTIYDEIQPMIDGNPYVSGNASQKNCIETDKFVLYASAEGIKHIMDRHADPYAPGSLLESGFNLFSEIGGIIQSDPTERDSRGMVKWMEQDLGKTVGYMGVAYKDPAEVANMQDYSMQGYQGIEKVKIAPGEREATQLLSLITAGIGQLSDGREVLSLVTVFPGGNAVGGVEIPHSRPQFAALGLYFVLPPDHASFEKDEA